ncbi:MULTISPECIES: DUF3581 family protein [Marinobacter]|jgi:hypothetical protein|uniref:DUF3581 domain-containing protein n=1 Tax=Marinobacter nauticus (strain ATCC 700491 / DSM 11845 / VT8) TaxID=351348 RepID=A1U0A4_MARN8|nr:MULTISPECIES: DUF3581 family protein [Marinobacter]MEC8898999.1 DUF3581 family protein [Pseudomonadota bacterium]ABM18423.1 conserved hypothetical protein [Marinobacter nauticus VT8]MBW3196226.1 DUF3581 domain-containing protein [Marinobacter nauticus]MBY6181636.1 DUF3581 domain-containing protein [Marinobacter nauticus]MEC9038039.1 DUF3581 family protein [Pseudomonadota bacterium]
MFSEQFYSVQDGRIVISAPQASYFAKEIAGDFNPIHDPDARRFCVPGDLLFTIVVSRFGLSENMTFKFRNLLGAEVPLEFRESDNGEAINVVDEAGKVYLEVTRKGAVTRDEKVIEEFSRCYVAASGKNFPHTLKPLMESHGVMFNPDRPMVMYESMSLALTQLENPHPDLELNNADLEVAGKRGNVTLEYNLQSSGKTVGEVAKRLVLGGLREYCPEAMAGIIEEFYRLKARGTRWGMESADQPAGL